MNTLPIGDIKNAAGSNPVIHSDAMCVAQSGRAPGRQ